MKAPHPMYYPAIKATLSAICGQVVGWGNWTGKLRYDSSTHRIGPMPQSGQARFSH